MKRKSKTGRTLPPRGKAADCRAMPTSARSPKKPRALRPLHLGPIARSKLPFAAPGQTVGLLGGSFDPPHRGHVAISKAALRRFKLDQLWWLITPGNPLKAHQPAPMAQRKAEGRRLMRHPRVKITDLEQQLGTRYTVQTLARLHQLYPHVRFIWLMGADNLAQFHRWGQWRAIANTTPLGILARPNEQMAALNAPAARTLRHARLPEHQSQSLGQQTAPAWCFVHLPLDDSSSSALRAQKQKHAPATNSEQTS